MSRLFLLVSVIACCASVALAGDRTLGTVSGPCKDQFSTIIRDNYAADSTCADTIKKAMNTAPKSDSDCPGGALANAGSSVQKCMSKDQVGGCCSGRPDGSCRAAYLLQTALHHCGPALKYRHFGCI